jgi:hypothetical protein
MDEQAKMQSTHSNIFGQLEDGNQNRSSNMRAKVPTEAHLEKVE